LRVDLVGDALRHDFGLGGADDLGNMFQFKRDFERDYCASRSVSCVRELNPRLAIFVAWLAANRQALRAAVGSAVQAT
jgi:hypothetical protein